MQSVGLLSRTQLSEFTFMRWRRKWQPTPVFLPGESQGRGSLVGCHLWGRTELDTTEATQQQQQQQPHFIHPLLCQQTFRLFPCFGYSVCCCCEDRDARVFLNYICLFLIGHLNLLSVHFGQLWQGFVNFINLLKKPILTQLIVCFLFH